MGIVAQIALWLVGDLIGGLIVEVLKGPTDWLFRPLTSRLRAPTGGRVLAIICVIAAGWFWLAWHLAANADNVWALRASYLSLFAAPLVALISFGVWYQGDEPPGRRRGSAY